MSKKTCFVVSIIGNEYSEERKHANNVLDYIIKPAVSEEFDVIRADTLYHSDRIDSKILEHLRSSELVIADLTNNNPNVFLEVGYRMALGLPTIYLIQISEQKLPFDIQSINIIHYDIKGQNTLKSAEDTKTKIQNTIKNITFNEFESSNIENSTQQLNEIKNMLLNLNDKIDNISAPQDKDTFNQYKMMELAMKSPESFSKLMDIMSKKPNFFQTNN